MTNQQKAMLVAFATVLVVVLGLAAGVAYMFRYQTQPNEQYLIVQDRWTGHVHVNPLRFSLGDNSDWIHTAAPAPPSGNPAPASESRSASRSDSGSATSFVALKYILLAGAYVVGGLLVAVSACSGVGLGLAALSALSVAMRVRSALWLVAFYVTGSALCFAASYGLIGLANYAAKLTDPGWIQLLWAAVVFPGVIALKIVGQFQCVARAQLMTCIERHHHKSRQD